MASGSDRPRRYTADEAEICFKICQMSLMVIAVIVSLVLEPQGSASLIESDSRI